MIQAKDTEPNLYIEPKFLTKAFDDAFPQITIRLKAAKCGNVIFNLDQCGYSHVTSINIKHIMSSWRSAEVLLTFMIESMLAFLSQQKDSPSVPLEPEVKQKVDLLLNDRGLLIKKQWLGEAEKIAFAHLKGCAPYVSPFSINNPTGWRYWLMHFANAYRARQVYNNVLHQNSMSQAHFGRLGLSMLSYNPAENEGQLYLFEKDSRNLAKKSLYDDIPRFIAESGDTMAMKDFYATAYSETPAHSDDIHEMIMKNPDMEVITEKGGKRREATAIKESDTLKLKSQKSLFFMFDDFS